MKRMPGREVLRRAIGLAALVAGIVAAPAAHASFDCGTALERCRVQLDNSGRAWFESYEKLTEDSLGDGTLQGGVSQIYERVGNQTLLVSRRPDGQPIAPEGKWPIAANLLGVSPDGERVYMSTEATLAPEDGDGGHGDGSTDGYVLSNGAYTLFTTGPLDGSGPNLNPYAGDRTVWASDDGHYVYFMTAQPLVLEDWDNSPDIYQRIEGQTRLVSTGPDEYLPTAEYPNPSVPESRFLGASPDGATAYFATAQHLTADDPGKSPSEGRLLTSDIFAWHDGVLTRLTRTVSPEEVPGTPWEAFDPYSFAGAAEEGSVYFVARSGQVPEDTDQNPDIYRAKPDGTLERVLHSGMEGPNSFLRVEAVSRDGSRIFLFGPKLMNTEGLTAEAAIYMWSDGRYQQINPRGRTHGKEEEVHLCSITEDGRRAYFQTWASLTPEDSDEEPDVYEWSDGRVRLVSPASDGRQSAAFCMGISPNGRFVAFATWEELVPGDNDVKEDIYVIDMGAGAGGSAALSRAAAGATASRVRPATRRRRHRRLRLVTAEAIAPRMHVARAGVIRDGTARLRVGCPKAERSGPCHGRVKLLDRRNRRVLAAGTFRIPVGRSAPVTLHGPGLRHRTIRALARVRGADMLRNRRTVTADVQLRPAR